jgi:hypothetical protein
MTIAPSDRVDVQAPDLRLHPLSWLFELLNVLRQFIVPIAILIFTGRSNNYAVSYTHLRAHETM